MRYLIQFPAGTGDLILDAISPYVKNFKVHYRDDSAMIFDSSATAGKVASIPFAKNSFVVIASTLRGFRINFVQVGENCFYGGVKAVEI